MLYNQPFDQASNPNASYVNGNPASGVLGSIPPAAAIEYPQRELVNLIAAAGITPSNNDLTQVAQAVRILGATPAGLIHYGTDSGGANAMIVATNPDVLEYAAGIMIITIPAADNTTATNINVDGLGNVAVLRGDASALQPGDIRGGVLTILVNDGIQFRLLMPAVRPTVEITAQGGAFTINPSNLTFVFNRSAPTQPSTATTPTSPKDGEEHWFEDVALNFSTQPVVITANSGQAFAGGLSTATFNIDGQCGRIKYCAAASTWSVKQ